MTQSASSTSPDIRKSDKWIPYYFIPFFLVVALVNGIFIYVALKSYTGVVTEDSYEKGVAYNKTLEAAALETQQQIKDTVTFKDGQIQWTLQDAKGSAIDKATVNVHFIRAVQDGHDFNRNLTHSGHGLYTAVVNPPLSGAWTAKLEATWDNQHYKTTFKFISP